MNKICFSEAFLILINILCNLVGDGIHVDDDGRDNKEIAASIHRYKESIALLGRTVQELSQVGIFQYFLI